MGIRIRKGSSETARNELWAFTNAYPAMQWADDGMICEYALFDPNDAPMFDAMEHNQVIATFEL